MANHPIVDLSGSWPNEPRPELMPESSSEPAPVNVPVSDYYEHVADFRATQGRMERELIALRRERDDLKVALEALRADVERMAAHFERHYGPSLGSELRAILRPEPKQETEQQDEF